MVFGTACGLTEIFGAILLIAGQKVGLYLAAVALVVYVAYLITGAWLLIVWTRPDPTD